MCNPCGVKIKKEHMQHNYVVAGGTAYKWEDGELYCIEHWRRWLRYGLCDPRSCQEWVAWAERTLRKCSETNTSETHPAKHTGGKGSEEKGGEKGEGNQWGINSDTGEEMGGKGRRGKGEEGKEGVSKGKWKGENQGIKEEHMQKGKGKGENVGKGSGGRGYIKKNWKRTETGNKGKVAGGKERRVEVRGQKKEEAEPPSAAGDFAMEALQLGHCSEALARQGRNPEIPVAGMCDFNVRYDIDVPVPGAWTGNGCTVDRGPNGPWNFEPGQADPGFGSGSGDGVPQILDPSYTWVRRDWNWSGGPRAAHGEVGEQTESMNNTPGPQLRNFEEYASFDNQCWMANGILILGTGSAPSFIGWNDQRNLFMPWAVPSAPSPYPFEWEQTGSDPW